MTAISTHSGVEQGSAIRAVPLHSLGAQSLVMLIATELLLLFGILAWALGALLPSATPLAAAHDLRPVYEAITARLVGDVLDPLVEVRPGVNARMSNLRGLHYAGTTYYYFIEGDTNFDPLSRGSVAKGDVELLLRDVSGPQVVVIYRLYSADRVG